MGNDFDSLKVSQTTYGFIKTSSGVTIGWQVGKMPLTSRRRRSAIWEDFQLPIFIIWVVLIEIFHPINLTYACKGLITPLRKTLQISGSIHFFEWKEYHSYQINVQILRIILKVSSKERCQQIKLADIRNGCTGWVFDNSENWVIQHNTTLSKILEIFTLFTELTTLSSWKIWRIIVIEITDIAKKIRCIQKMDADGNWQ